MTRLWKIGDIADVMEARRPFEMAINSVDGQFALDCWIDPESEDYADSIEYSDNVEELREHAEKLIRAGRYKYVLLSRWSAKTEDWDELDVYD